jgi:hypothetical protein
LNKKPEISELISSIRQSSDRVQQSLGGLSESQLNWKPAPEKWSVGECIDHLITTNKAYFPALDRIAAGEHKNSLWQKISPLSGLWGSMLLKMVSPEYPKKAKTPAVFKPASSSVSKNIIDDFVKCNEQFTAYLQKFDGIDLKKTVIASPVNSFITYSLNDTIKIITYHEVRHLDQAERVTQMDGFPKQ